MNEREKFINALKENEDDTNVRLAFADWLDEQGEHEEADRHRKWTASKAWIICFCEDTQPRDDSGDFDDFSAGFQYSALMKEAWNAVDDATSKKGQGSIHCGRDDFLVDSPEEWAEFWKHWSIVTGLAVSKDVIENIYYTCSC